jgi:hypothetical protein
LEAAVKPGARIAMVYALSMGVAAAVSASRGRKGGQIVGDALLFGIPLGIVVDGIIYVTEPFDAAEARKNAGEFGRKITQDGMKLLAQIDTDKVYANLNRDGVRVMPQPANPSLIFQDEH